ncbi:hypothetical protein DFP72DRAFT_1138055 [Ephemerocybe angulata]|uniref:Uncharacterized protein n=1 Tax=Ephemerocybe angulata TaxID=980116 RepID=A0A8H6HQW8_9AGAR|nr:hypothetical protein DFP72DRAFT_1138055 [Tulosesus angulatus]
MTSHWTQRDQDKALGLRRVAYDADTSQYTFMDENGALFRSEPGSEYGQLIRVPNHIEKVELERPEAFQDNPRARPSGSVGHAPKTFQEFLPSTSLTTTGANPTPISNKSSTPKKHPKDKVKSAVSMSGVVLGLKRNVISLVGRRSERDGASDVRRNY